MKEILTIDEKNQEEVGGKWACLVACVAGCGAINLVVPGAGAALAAWATATSFV